MSRRKGELSNAAIDRQWPHQVALKAPLGKAAAGHPGVLPALWRGSQASLLQARGGGLGLHRVRRGSGRPGVPRPIRRDTYEAGGSAEVARLKSVGSRGPAVKIAGSLRKR